MADAHPAPRWEDRVVPRFIRAWLGQWRGDPEGRDPVGYLDQDAGVGFAIAAAWLFCPETVEYLGGIFLKRKFDRANVDAWLNRYDLVTAQVITNELNLWYDVLGNAESVAFDEEAEVQLVWALGECWNGVLAQRYPEHDIRVSVDPSTDQSQGPTVTLWSRGASQHRYRTDGMP